MSHLTEPVEALTYGALTAVMDEGRVLQLAPAIEVFWEPATARVAKVFSDPPMNLIPAGVDAGTVTIAGIAPFPVPGHFPADVSGSVLLGVRPHLVSLRRHSDTDLEVSGILGLAELTGSETILHVEHAAGVLIVQANGIHSHALGERMSVFVPDTALFAFAGPEGELIANPTWHSIASPFAAATGGGHG